MTVKVLLLANSHVPLHRAQDGMERSTYELVESLSRNGEVLLSVIANCKSILPDNARLLPCSPQPCPPEYLLSGDGPSKWTHVANDAAITESVIGLHPSDFDIVHDCSSAVTPLVYLAGTHSPSIKTIRLHPAHPSSSITARFRCWTVHLSRFQQQMDKWCDKMRCSVISDPVRIPEFPTTVRRGFISIGRVERRKGHDVAASVARHFGERLRIVGRIIDPDFAHLLEREYDCELCGEQDAAATVALIAGSSALVWTPTIPEPGGRVVIEALRCRTPVIATRFGYAADIADYIGGSSLKVECCAGVFVRIESLPDWWTQDTESLGRQYVRAYELALNRTR